MGRLNHHMLGQVDELLLLAGISPPQHKDDPLWLQVDHTNDLIGKGLPTLVAMRRRLVCPHGEHGVQQQNSLAGPSVKVAMIRRRHPKIGFEFLVNVSQRRRDLHPTANRETQAMGLAGPVIGVLTEDQHLGLGIWSEAQRSEHRVVWREDLKCSPLVLNKSLKLRPIWLVELLTQDRIPVGRDRGAWFAQPN